MFNQIFQREQLTVKTIPRLKNINNRVAVRVSLSPLSDSVETL
jgi:hypothetical protein